MRRSNALMSLAAACAALALSIVAAAAQVTDKVPKPRLRPDLASDASAPRPPAVVAPSKPGFFQKLFAKPSAPAAPAAPSRFPPADAQALAKISAYFNSFSTMEGKFIQFGPRGEQSEGTFYIARPGKLRFTYAPPVKQEVIADGRNVAIRNNRLNTQEIYPLSKTPLRYLLANNVDLTNDNLVNQVRRESDLISVVIVQKSGLGQFKLTLIFDAKTYELRQWIVTDAQGLNTSTAVYNTTTGVPPDPALFRIKYNNMPTP